MWFPSKFRGPPSWYSDPITTEHRITTFFGPQGISVAMQRWAVRSHCKDTPFAGAGATANCMSRTHAKYTQQDAGRGRADLPLQHFSVSNEYAAFTLERDTNWGWTLALQQWSASRQTAHIRFALSRAVSPAAASDGHLGNLRNMRVCAMLGQCRFRLLRRIQRRRSRRFGARQAPGSGGVLANPHMLRCWPALLTAASWQRCQWRNARWPERAIADSRFDQPSPGLGRSVHHSQSVKGGGASSPVSNVSIPSWCHRNHPSTTPPALGRWTCCKQGCFGWRRDCPASVYRYQEPYSQVHQDPRHQMYWQRGSGVAAPGADTMDKSCHASVVPSRWAGRMTRPRTRSCLFAPIAGNGCPAAHNTEETWT